MDVVDRLLFRISPKRAIHGIPTAIIFSSPEERERSFQLLEDAFGLIATYAPVRHRQLLLDITRILVTSANPGTEAKYYAKSRSCTLNLYWLRREATVALDVATTLVHEGQHGRLYRLGIGHNRGSLLRVERICYRSERVFASRVPGAELLWHRASAAMEFDGAMYSVAAHYERQAAGIRDAAFPESWERFLLWLNKRLEARALRKARLH